MKSLKKIKSEIEVTSQVKGIVEVFEELSAIRMKKIRDDILGSRDFLERLANLSFEVGSDFGAVSGSKTSACVYLSSTSGMYGDLPEKVFNSFLSFLDKNKTDVFIFGKQGKILVEKFKPNLKYNFYELDDRKNAKDMMNESLKLLLNFDQITVFYGKFRNIVNQDAVSQSILGDYEDNFSKIDKKELMAKQFKYIYEPNVLEVSNKFATEIKASVFEGMINENDLAKTASRMMHLDQSFENIEGQLSLLKILKNKENKRVEDKKQQERVKRLII